MFGKHLVDQYARQERGREADSDIAGEGERHPEPRGEGSLGGMACALFKSTVTHFSQS